MQVKEVWKEWNVKWCLRTNAFSLILALSTFTRSTAPALQARAASGQMRSGQQQVLTAPAITPWSVAHSHGHQTVTSEHPEPRTLLPPTEHLWCPEVEKMELKVWITFIAKFYFSSNLVNTQSSDIPTAAERENYEYLTEQGPGQGGASHYVTGDNLHKHGHAVDKGEDRVDLRPLRDFLAALPWVLLVTN